MEYDSVEITNKMQLYNRIYHSTVYWRLNMFRAAHLSSSGAPTLFTTSDLHTHVVTGRSQVWVGTAVPTQTWLLPVTTCLCKPEVANTVGAPDDELWPAVVKSEWELAVPTQTWLRLVTTCVCNQRLQIQLELLMMSGMPLETCWTVGER